MDIEERIEDMIKTVIKNGRRPDELLLDEEDYETLQEKLELISFPDYVIEGNKLIAQFYWPDSVRSDAKMDEWEYHSSWDWLIPVIQKCKEIARKHEEYSICRKYYMNITISIQCVKIEYVYESVIKFINWYNNQEK
jgi:hypothetical protein